MNVQYRKKIEKLESHFSPYATKSTESRGREFPLVESSYRTPFERDCHRVLHSLPFRRLKHKTQVFFSPKDDHICTRMEHSLHVASIATTVCIRLDLNPTLAEAIALSHDLGHAPFGHLGEKALDDISKKHGLSGFKHEAQSLRVIDCFKNKLHGLLSLTFEVRDGVVCHWGETEEQILEPDSLKDITKVDITAARKQHPATLEGCVVRMCDTISYLGRDFEDATMAKFLKSKNLPDNIKKNLGTNNSRIIGTLIDDLVRTSTNNNYLMYSDRIYKSLKDMKDFNNENIYQKQELSGQGNRIQLIFEQIFDHFLKELEQGTEKHKDYYCLTFAEFIKDMKYDKDTSNAQKVVDFIAGMTDNFALGCFQDLFSIERII